MKAIEVEDQEEVAADEAAEEFAEDVAEDVAEDAPEAAAEDVMQDAEADAAEEASDDAADSGDSIGPSASAVDFKTRRPESTVAFSAVSQASHVSAYVADTQAHKMSVWTVSRAMFDLRRTTKVNIVPACRAWQSESRSVGRGDLGFPQPRRRCGGGHYRREVARHAAQQAVQRPLRAERLSPKTYEVTV